MTDERTLPGSLDARRSMFLETLARVTDNPAVGLPAVAA